MSSETPVRPLVDLKEALSSHRKPDITHVRTPLLNYCARGCEYGDDVYERANYLRPVAPGGYTGTPTAEDFKRCRAYMRALVSHGYKVLDAMERHQSTDPRLEDVEGMKRAVFAADEDASETATRKGVGASFLPHLAHCASTLNMVLTQAAACGLLPADPGRTWGGASSVTPPPKQAHEAFPEGRIAASQHDYIAKYYPRSDCALGKCVCRERTYDPGPYWPPPTRPEGPL